MRITYEQLVMSAPCPRCGCRKIEIEINHAWGCKETRAQCDECGLGDYSIHKIGERAQKEVVRKVYSRWLQWKADQKRAHVTASVAFGGKP